MNYFQVFFFDSVTNVLHLTHYAIKRVKRPGVDGGFDTHTWMRWNSDSIFEGFGKSLEDIGPSLYRCLGGDRQGAEQAYGQHECTESRARQTSNDRFLTCLGLGIDRGAPGGNEPVDLQEAIYFSDIHIAAHHQLRRSIISST